MPNLLLETDHIATGHQVLGGHSVPERVQARDPSPVAQPDDDLIRSIDVDWLGVPIHEQEI